MSLKPFKAFVNLKGLLGLLLHFLNKLACKLLVVQQEPT